jgi:hypothetical protein
LWLKWKIVRREKRLYGHQELFWVRTLNASIFFDQIITQAHGSECNRFIPEAVIFAVGHCVSDLLEDLWVGILYIHLCGPFGLLKP